MMPALTESQAIDDLAGLLYDFLPGSGNPNLSFPVAANQAGVSECWNLGGSKRPAIVRLLESTYVTRHDRFCPLIIAIVRLALSWRRRKDQPLTREEIDRLNRILLRLKFKIPDLHDTQFLNGLESGDPAGRKSSGSVQIDSKIFVQFHRKLLAMAQEDSRTRGFSFERFLASIFDLFGLAPHGSFRLTGEQIDGSFLLTGETYLLEAKWQGPQVGNRDLQSFAASVRTKSDWSRGLFVSYSGFSTDGLAAFGRGSATRIICLDGFDLSEILGRQLNFADVLQLKARRAAETGLAHVSVRDLFRGNEGGIKRPDSRP